MIVVPLTGGPKLLKVRNTDLHKPTYLDFEPDGDKLNGRREILAAGEGKMFRVPGNRYATVTAPPCVQFISVEEA